MREIVGASQFAGEVTIGLVAAQFNDHVVRSLVSGAVDTLRQAGISESSIDLVWVPGALEIPLLLREMRDTGRYAGLIALGCIIRGETGHYDVVVNQSAGQVAALATQADIPIANGILTVETMDQAINRAGGKAGNKGSDCARTIVQLHSVIQQVRSL